MVYSNTKLSTKNAGIDITLFIVGGGGTLVICVAMFVLQAQY